MPRRRSNRAQSGCCERGQASLLMLAVVGALLAGAVVLFAFGNALGDKGRYQRAADLAAISAAQVMRDLYPRLFEPPFVEPDVPNPRHLEEAEYRALAVAAAIRGGRRIGVEIDAGDVTFPDSAFAPTRVTVRVRGEATVRLPGRPRLRGDTRVRSVGREPARGGSGRDAFARVPIRARATAELLPDAGGAGLPDHASGGGYDGPLAAGEADAPRRGARLRPHGQGRARGGGTLPARHERLPLRRRAGEAVRRPAHSSFVFAP